VVTYILFAWMTNIDVLIAKRFLSEQQTGYYVAITTLAKLLFFISTALTDAMFSHLASADREHRGARVFYQTLLLDVVLCLLAIGGAIVLAEPVMVGIYGLDFSAAAPYLWKALLVSCVFTVIIVYTKGFLARGKTHFLPVLFLGAALEAALLLRFHESLDQILSVLLFCNVITVLSLVIIELSGSLRRVAANRNISVPSGS
jgi:O-antigen/teichoic acid export membrane protein